MWYFQEFGGISKNHKHRAVCNFWCRMTIPMLDTLLKISECIFFEKLFWVPWGTTFDCKVTLIRLVDIFLIQNLNEFSDFKDNMGTIVVPKKLCCKLWNQSFKILYLTCTYEVFERFYYALKSDTFAWFQRIDQIKAGLCIRQKHQTSKFSKIL